MFFKRWTDAFYKQHLLFLFSGLIASCIVHGSRSNQANGLNGLWRQYFWLKGSALCGQIIDDDSSQALYVISLHTHSLFSLLRPHWDHNADIPGSMPVTRSTSAHCSACRRWWWIEIQWRHSLWPAIHNLDALQCRMHRHRLLGLLITRSRFFISTWKLW